MAMIKTIEKHDKQIFTINLYIEKIYFHNNTQ